MRPNIYRKILLPMCSATQMKRKEIHQREAASGSFLHQSTATEKNQKIANSAQDWWERGGKDGRRGLRLQLHVFCILVFHATLLYTHRELKIFLEV